jgi:hypothetical protein
MSKLLILKDSGNTSSCCGGEAEPAQDIRDVVKQRYGQAVKAVVAGAKPSCCGSSYGTSATGMGGTDPITRDLYAADQTSGLPEEAVLASFGCGNPDGAGRAAAGRSRPRSWLGRRHRRASLGQAGRPERQGFTAST